MRQKLPEIPDFGRFSDLVRAQIAQIALRAIFHSQRWFGAYFRQKSKFDPFTALYEPTGDGSMLIFRVESKIRPQTRNWGSWAFREGS